MDNKTKMKLWWEFQRRNPEYIKQYNDLKGEYPEAIDMRQFFVMGFQAIGKSPEWPDKVKEFCAKWLVGFPMHPNYDPDRHIKFKEKKFGEFLKKFDKDFASLDGDDDLTVYPNIIGKNKDRFILESLISFEPISFIFPPLPVINDLKNYEFDVDYNPDGNMVKRIVSDEVAETGKLSITIDLRQSKAALLEEFKRLIDDWKPRYEKIYKHRLFRKYCNGKNIHSFPVPKEVSLDFENYYKEKLKVRLPKQNKKILELESYQQYLKVWDMKEKEGKSWSEIQRVLNLNSMQTARDYKKAADRLIEEGFPLQKAF